MFFMKILFSPIICKEHNIEFQGLVIAQYSLKQVMKVQTKVNYMDYFDLHGLAMS